MRSNASRVKTCAARVTVKDLAFTMSTSNVDRDGDRVEQNWKTTGPVPFLLFHDWNQLPLGYVKDLQSDGKRTTFKVDWAPADAYPMAGVVKALYESGHMKAVSPGFVPLKTKDVTPEDRQKAGLCEYGTWVEEAELLEVSAVNIPANAEALVQASAGKKMVAIHRGAGHEAPEVMALVTKGLNVGAVKRWMEKTTMAEEAAVKEMDAAACAGLMQKCIGHCDAMNAMLEGGEAVSAEELKTHVDACLALCKECLAMAGGEAAPMAEEEESAPPPAKALRLLIQNEIAAMLKSAVAENTADTADDEIEEPTENEKEYEEIVSDSERLSILAATLAGGMQKE